jgi:aldose sugar dehydrogenase
VKGSLQRSRSRKRLLLFGIAITLTLLGGGAATDRAPAQAEPGPALLAPNLELRTVVDGLELPTSIAFVGSNDLLVLEKNSGKVKRVVNGVVQSTDALDLPVNFGSERGLLGIALHPDFPTNPGVYLFWTESSTGADTGVLSETPLLGNRVDRFVWTGSALVFDRSLIRLRAIQQDFTTVATPFGTFTQPERGNHDGGVITFGPDRKLYVLFGDIGRRGQLQNLPNGPFGPGIPDDQFGGPQPDDAHFSGVVLRLNDDGSTPSDNPFFGAGAAIGGEVGANVQQIYSYGLRNSFGMAFDPASGALWTQENGEDAFDELNRVEAGENSGWVQIVGPASRVAEYKAIETTSLHHEDFPNLQQFRWGPERIADTPAEALARLFVLPGSRYSDPEFSWKHVLAPAAIGFVKGRGIGPQYANDLFVGFSVPEPLGGPLFHLNLTGSRKAIAVDDPRLNDRVADNLTFHDMTESESLLIGTNFGIVTDIETAPSGDLLVVSLDQGAIYQISGR